MPSQPATSTQPQCQQERLAGTSLLTQPSWHSCQEQAPAKFQSLSRCRLISPAFALSSSLLAIDFLSLFSLTRSFTSCCSNLCNSALIRTQIFFFFFSFAAVELRPSFVSGFPTQSFSAEAVDLQGWPQYTVPSWGSSSPPVRPWHPAALLTWLLSGVLFFQGLLHWSGSLPSQVISLSDSPPCWWSSCSLHVWLLKLLVACFLCWCHVEQGHCHAPSTSGTISELLWSRQASIPTGSF